MTKLITTELQEKLDAYVDDTENAVKNFELALEYEKLEQYASAISYFLRASEITKNNNFEYESLIHMGICFDRMQNREYSTCQTFRKAMVMMPARPEAYYLLCRFYNWHNRYDEAHHLADLGLRSCDFNGEKLEYSDYIEYDKLKTFLIFEKAVSAWWWGRLPFCKEGFDTLLNDRWDDLTEYQQGICKKYEAKFKFHPAWHDPIWYTPKMYEKLKHKFPGAEKIKMNYSQIYQDIFVLTMLDGKKDGYFVEIGSGNPFYGNNTAILETYYGWKGVAIDKDEKLSKKYRDERPKIEQYLEDVLTFDWTILRDKNIKDNVIDYLQFDIDPPVNTYQSLLDFPLDEFPARVITYEHDYYADEHKRYRSASREYLRSKGYFLVAGNMSPDGKCPFEDWWVHPDLVDPLIIEKMIFRPYNATPDYNDEDVVINSYLYMFNDNISPEDIPEKSENEIIQLENSSPDIFKINEKQEGTVWVIDNFYEDPDSVREFALQQEFIEGGWGRGFIGRRTDTQFLFPGLKEKFETIMGKEITNWEIHTENGKFQNCVAGEPITWHCDAQRWGGLLYLSPDPPFKCGTSLYAHKHNRARSFNDKDYEVEWRIPSEKGEATYYGGEHCDGTQFEPVDVMGNVYNRLIIFDARCIHAASEYFGYNLQTGRLWQMFFFDTK